MHESLAILEDGELFDKTVRGRIVKVGRQDDKEPQPVLFVNEELASIHLSKLILYALDSDDDGIADRKWNWYKKPVIEKFSMTECSLGSLVQRVVQPRYAGYCEIEVLDEPT